MDTLNFDSTKTGEQRRVALYDGQIFVFSPRASVLALRDFTMETLRDAFAPYRPEMAQHHLSVEAWVERFARVKPVFMHDPRTRELLRAVVADFGCDPEDTFIDPPRLRGVTARGYLTSGVGYVHHPHRDTWYSAPMAQINWWFALAPFDRESALAFHPRYWRQGLRNESSEFNYYRWNAEGRRDAAKHISADTRKQPRALEPVEMEPQVRVVCAAGGLILFSGAQLHSTVPNTLDTTRFSIDFRTVSLADLRAGRGAPNVDSAPEGTSLRDFVRCSDFEPVPGELVERYDSGGGGGVLVYRPS